MFPKYKLTYDFFWLDLFLICFHVFKISLIVFHDGYQQIWEKILACIIVAGGVDHSLITIHIPTLPHTTLGISGTAQFRRGVLDIPKWKSGPGYSLPNRAGMEDVALGMVLAGE